MEPIYLDYASTTPVDPDVIRAMEPYLFERFGNAASPHSFGREANKALEDARQNLAGFIGASAEEVIFTSGATESNNHALVGVAARLQEQGRHIIISAIEHHSVYEPAENLEREGWRVTYVKPDSDGLIDPTDIKKALTDQTVLIAVMHASNEIGTIQPVAEIGAIAREREIPFLVDAVQTVGHLPVNVDELKADLLSLSAHKFYGPKGIGALYIRKGTPIQPFLRGGGQERDRRASTQNVAGAVGLAKALELCKMNMSDEAATQQKLRDRLLTEIPKLIDGVKVNGHRTSRLPNNAHFAFQGLQSEAILMSLDMTGIAASMGSACTAGSLEPSHVLRAIGLGEDLIHGALRITLGRWTKSEHMDYLIEQLPPIIARLRV